MTWTKSAMPYIMGWGVIYLYCCFKHKSKEGFLIESQFALAHSMILVVLAAISLYFNDENICSEATPLDFSFSFFVIDLLDCVIRGDAIFTVHAVISLALNYLTARPVHFQLRSGSKGSLAELSTPLYYLWKKTKRKRHYQYFGVVFFLSRLVWVPYFVYRTLEVTGFDDIVIWASIAFIMLQCVFFYKYLVLLLNYKEPSDNMDSKPGDSIKEKKSQ